MTEQQQTTSTSTETVEEVETPGAPFDQERAMEKIRKSNSEALNLRRRVKELEPFEAAARAAEEAKKTEAQQFAEKLAAATERAEKAELGLLRERVARKAKLPDALAERLRGTTEEELTADAQTLAAQTLAAWATDAQQSGVAERRRAPDPSQGQGVALNGDPLLDSLKAKLGI